MVGQQYLLEKPQDAYGTEEAKEVGCLFEKRKAELEQIRGLPVKRLL